MDNKKKKVGIISEFSVESVNYGNNLQAYALNKFLTDRYSYNRFETICLGKQKKKITKFLFGKVVIGKVLNKILIKIRVLITRYNNKDMLDKMIDRLDKFKKFARKNIITSPFVMNFEKIKEPYYDMYVVGSDIVWMQRNNMINRVKFLDFKSDNNDLRKVAYSASFGGDWIPKENRKVVRKCLEDFKCISVRENSSVDLLKNIGVNNAIHTVDPTLLLDKNEWKKVEEMPIIDGKKIENYVFMYMLGDDEKQRRYIYEFCKKNKFNVVTVPYAGGELSKVYNFEKNYIYVNCSPGEWIWLIEHAEYVITDSFHGTVFSTIFNKRFVVVERFFLSNINNRMIDYLKMIEQSDKMVKLSQDVDISDWVWDYDSINKIIEREKKISVDYLDNAFLEKVAQ